MSKQASLSFIGLGSNMDSHAGDSSDTLKAALESLDAHPLITVEKCSSCYQTKAIGPKQEDYLNAVACIKCNTTALELLEILNEIEASFGRNREQEIRWGPRSLDLDILLFDGLSMKSEKLTVPHPELENRGFVLIPLFEIAAELELPNHKKLKTLAENCPQDGIMKTAQTLWQ